jgi:hypothetical protein
MKYKVRKKYATGGEIGSAIGSTVGLIPGIGPAVGPLASLAGGLIGGMFNKKPKTPINTVAGSNQGYRYGGKVKPLGGGAKKFVGPKHEQGGILIDEQGNPANQQEAIAEVEGGETMQNDYIFSDELMVPETDMTFADAHEMLIAEGASPEEIDELAQMQEQVKQSEGVADPSMGEQPMEQAMMEEGVMAKGGKLPKYQVGGNTGLLYTTPDSYTNPNSRFTAGSNYANTRPTELPSSNRTFSVGPSGQTKVISNSRLARTARAVGRGVGRLGAVGSAGTAAYGVGMLVGNSIDNYVNRNTNTRERRNQGFLDNLRSSASEMRTSESSTAQTGSLAQSTKEPLVGGTGPVKDIPTQPTQQPTRQQRGTANPNVSVVDYLNSIGKDGSRTNRNKIAKRLGIDNYTGTAAQNTRMLRELRQENSQQQDDAAVVPAQPTQTVRQPAQSTTPGGYADFFRGYSNARVVPSNTPPVTRSASTTPSVDEIIDDRSDPERNSYSRRNGGKLPKYNNGGGFNFWTNTADSPTPPIGNTSATAKKNILNPSNIGLATQVGSRLGAAMFAPRPKATPRASFVPQSTTSPVFADARGRNAAGFTTAMRGGNSQAAYAQYLQGMSGIASQEAEFSRQSNLANEQMRMQTEEQNTNRLVADRERGYQDWAGRAGLAIQATDIPVTQKRQDSFMKSQTINSLMMSVDGLEEPDRSRVLRQRLNASGLFSEAEISSFTNMRFGGKLKKRK